MFVVVVAVGVVAVVFGCEAHNSLLFVLFNFKLKIFLIMSLDTPA